MKDKLSVIVLFITAIRELIAVVVVITDYIQSRRS
jgi:hypothetical protein